MKKITSPDINFTDEKMNRLMQHVRALTQEVQRLQSLLEAGNSGQVLMKNSARDYDADWQNP